VKSKRIATIAAVTALSIAYASSAAAQALAEPASPRVVMAPTSVIRVEPPPARRPMILPALYVSLGAVQAWDVYSTSSALKAGATERNPLVAPIAGNSAGMVALKVGTAATTVFFAERLWKKNRIGAIVMMAGINGATAAIAMRNIRNARAAGAR
jgi:Domain of unknown function (DUF5658)